MPTPPKKKAGVATGPRGMNGEGLDVAGLAALLGTTEKTVRSRTARNLLPYRRWGGRVVYLRAEISNFLSGLDGVTLEQARANQAARSGGAP